VPEVRIPGVPPIKVPDVLGGGPARQEDRPADPEAAKGLLDFLLGP
jgi:hypothetical protein